MSSRNPLALLDAAIGIPLRLGGRVSVGRGSRLIWRRIRVPRGNHLVVGANTLFGASVSFEATGGEIRVGDRCYIGKSRFVCHSEIVIGNDVIMSWGCTIVDHNSHSVAWAERENDVLEWARGRKEWAHVKRAPVIIEDKVWVGFDVSVLKGVRVGRGSVIGAASVVTRDVPPDCLVAGNPARVIRKLADNER